MQRRALITLLGGAVIAWPLAARAQQPAKIPLIGVLVSASPPHPFADAFGRGLRALGYSEGQNIRVEFRYSEGRSDRTAELAAELVRSDVAMIVAHFTPAVRAAMAATKTIPIVMAPAGAPLQSGFIKSLSEPGGVLTDGDLRPLQHRVRELSTSGAAKRYSVSMFVNPRPDIEVTLLRESSGGVGDEADQRAQTFEAWFQERVRRAQQQGSAC